MNINKSILNSFELLKYEITKIKYKIFIIRVKYISILNVNNKFKI